MMRLYIALMALRSASGHESGNSIKVGPFPTIYTIPGTKRRSRAHLVKAKLVSHLTSTASQAAI